MARWWQPRCGQAAPCMSAVTTPAVTSTCHHACLTSRPGSFPGHWPGLEHLGLEGRAHQFPPLGAREAAALGDWMDTLRSTGGQVGARSRAGWTGTNEEPPMAERSELLSGGARAVLTKRVPECWVDGQAGAVCGLLDTRSARLCPQPRPHRHQEPFLSFPQEGGCRRLTSPMWVSGGHGTPRAMVDQMVRRRLGPGGLLEPSTPPLVCPPRVSPLVRKVIRSLI